MGEPLRKSGDELIRMEIKLPAHIWDRVERHSRKREMSFDSALAELITIGFADSPAYRGE